MIILADWDAQVDMDLRYPDLHEDTFSHGALSHFFPSPISLGRFKQRVKPNVEVYND